MKNTELLTTLRYMREEKLRRAEGAERNILALRQQIEEEERSLKLLQRQVGEIEELFLREGLSRDGSDGSEPEPKAEPGVNDHT